MTGQARRVTFLGPVPPIAGGIASHSALVADALVAAGVDTQVVSWASQYPRFLYKGSGVDATVTPYPGAQFSLRWWDPTSWLRAGRGARTSDLLVMQWVTPVHALPERVVAATARNPFSLIVHNAIPHERMPFDTQLARWVMRRAAQIVVHAETVADEVREIAPAVPVSVVPLPPLIPVALTPLPAERSPLRVLCLGFVRPYKGFDLAVDAVRSLRANGSDVRLTIAGEVWEEREQWEQRVRDPALDGSVTLVSRYLTEPEVAEQLAAHHIVLAPYRSASQSGVVSLAYAAGRPVVATDVGGLRESVVDGVTGRLVEAASAEAIAKGIADVSADLDGFAERAAAMRWSWDDVARAVLRPVSGDPSSRPRP
jgi:glycosyltransferase involved in cell wall biosynthesis